MDTIVRFVAASALRRHKRNRADYDTDVADWFRAGDGRPPRWIEEVVYDDTDEPIDVARVNVGGKGYAYPACPHGMSQWTDYDNICGPCEDGYTAYQLALAEAHTVAREYRHRSDIVAALPRDRFTESAWKEITEWGFEPLDPYLREHSEHNNLHRTPRKVAWRYANTWPKPEPEPSLGDREAQAHYDDTWRS